MTPLQLSKAETSQRTNVVVEERAAFVWISKAFRTTMPRVQQTADRCGASDRTNDDSGALSSSSVESDEEKEQRPSPISQPHADDETNRILLTQSEWQVFEDKARILRRLVEEEHDAEALKQLQHLKKPKGARLRKSELPSVMLASRYLRAEESTQQDPSQLNATLPAIDAHNLLVSREQAARKRRLQQQQQQEVSPPAVRSDLSMVDSHAPVTFGGVTMPKPSRATKLPSLQPMSAESYTPAPYAGIAAPSHTACNFPHPAATTGIAGTTVSPDMLPIRLEHAHEVVQDAIDLASESAATRSSPCAAGAATPSDAASSAAEREASNISDRWRREKRHVEETERMLRIECVDDEGESRRSILREELMHATAITRRERERAAAEREAAFRVELQHTEERRHFEHFEASERLAVSKDEQHHRGSLERSRIDLFEENDRSTVASYEREERAVLGDAQASERRLCARLLEERRVREEAERRIRRFAERRAQEERERIYAEKFRADVKDQMQVLALEVSQRHSIENFESASYVDLVRHSAEVRDVVATLREALIKREADERLERERDMLRKRLAKEHADRRDLIMDEDKARTVLSKERLLELQDTLAPLELRERSRASAASAQRHLIALVILEGQNRDIVESSEHSSRTKLEGFERITAISVLERVKLREAEEARRAFESANRLLQEALDAKHDAANRLNEETQRIEQEREQRRREQLASQIAGQLALAENEETLHRQLIHAARQADLDTLQSREAASLDILRSRIEAAEQRRLESERSMARMKSESDEGRREWLRRMEVEQGRWMEEARQISSQPRSVESSVPRSARSTYSPSPQAPTDDNAGDAQHRFIELQLAMHRTEEETRLRRLEDEELLRQQHLDFIAASLAEFARSEDAVRGNVESLEDSCRVKLLRMRDISRRAARDRENLRLLESGEEVVDDEPMHIPSHHDSHSPIRRFGALTAVFESCVLEEASARMEISRAEVATFSDAFRYFRENISALTRARVESEKEALASRHSDVAALLAQERERQQREKLNAVYAALFAVVKAEKEGREMMHSADASSRSQMAVHCEHHFVIAKAAEKKRIAAEEEAARVLRQEQQVAAQQAQEIELYHAKHRISLEKDEVIHRQVVELAEQADMDNLCSRALHTRVVIEAKEAARLRQQERELEERGVLLARIDMFLQQVVSDESHKRTVLLGDEFSQRRQLSEWALFSEAKCRDEDARRLADELRTERRSTTTTAALPATSNSTQALGIPHGSLDHLPPWERVIKEKEAALLRATAQALQPSQVVSPSKSTATSPEKARPPIFAMERRASSFTESDIRAACASLDAKSLQLFTNEEQFLRTSISGSEHTIRRDIMREERHLRRRHTWDPRSLRAGLSPQLESHNIAALQNALDALLSQESYLRLALDTEEHESMLMLLSFARSNGLVSIQKEVSPLRRRLEAINQAARDFSASFSSSFKFFRARMEVIFQAEYHQREQIIAEYNRGKLSEMMAPFEREIAVVNLTGEELTLRRAIEVDEATVTTKFLRRLKRHFKMYDMFAESSEQARSSLLDEYRLRLKSLSLEDLHMLVYVPLVRPTSVPTVVEPSRFPTRSDAPMVYVVPQAAPPPPQTAPVGSKRSPSKWAIEAPSDSDDGADPFPGPPPALLMAKASPLKFKTDLQLRDAIVETEIEQAQARKQYEAKCLRTLSELHRISNHLISIRAAGDAALLSLHLLFERYASNLSESRKRTSAAEKLSEIQRDIFRLEATESKDRAARVQAEHAIREHIIKGRLLVLDLEAQYAKAKRSRCVLYESVELEYTSAAKLAAERVFQRNAAALAAEEEKNRHAIAVDEAAQFRGVRRDIVDFLDMKAKINVELIVQRRSLIVQQETDDRLQLLLTHDLLLRLAQRFLRLQVAMEGASETFYKAKQTWCLEQCLAVQQQVISLTKVTQMHSMMAIEALVRVEGDKREALEAMEEAARRLESRYDRFVSALASFAEKCLAAKIAIVERLAPGLPPPASVSAARLPRLKSMLQRSQSMALVINNASSNASLSSSLMLDSSAAMPNEHATSPVPSALGTSMSFDGGRGAGLAGTGKSFRSGPSEAELGRFDIPGLATAKSFVSLSSSAAFSPGRRSPAVTSFVEQSSPEAVLRKQTPSFDSDAAQQLPAGLDEIATLVRSNDPACKAVDCSPFKDVLTVAHLRIIAALSTGNTNADTLQLANVQSIGVDWVEPILRIANRFGALDLTNCNLTDDFVVALCDKMVVPEFGDGIRSIILDANPKLTATVASHIARFARTAHSVLERCSLRDVPSVTQVHVRWLAFYLDLNKQHKQFKAVILAVEAKQVIPRLNFSIPRSNKSGSSANLKGADALFRREFDDRSVRLACIAMANNTTVESISFRGNRITDKGAKMLATILQRNTTIKEVDLSYNELTNEGAAEFETILSNGNTTLLHLDLSENKGITSVETLQRIANKLRKNLENQR